MKRVCTRSFALLLALALSVSVCAADELGGAAQYVYDAAPAPVVGSVGGEWAVIGLARSGCDVDASYYGDYASRVERTVKAAGGVLSTRKYTEYARVILGLTAVGRDARSVGGYDLTQPLGDYTATVRQGVNGAIFALLALDSAAYPMPTGSGAAVPATRQMYVGAILDAQKADGGWSLAGETAQADITAMALQALARYRAQTRVERAVSRGIACLSKLQKSDGTFFETDVTTSESCAQVILALCELGIACDDPRFVKNGVSVRDALLSFRTAKGGFRHIAVGAVDQMASEQALLALAAIERAENGQRTLYDMSDALRLPAARVTFSDVSAHKSRAAVEALAVRGVVNGKGDGRFDPDGTLTRAEFAAILTRGVGLTPQTTAAFTDVAAGSWYAPYVGAAYASGIVKGVGDGKRFAPDLTITRQEAAVMLQRAAQYAGLDTRAPASGARADDWARAGVDYCIAAGLLTKDDLRPGEFVLRGEMAQMIHGLLSLGKML